MISVSRQIQELAEEPSPPNSALGLSNPFGVSDLENFMWDVKGSFHIRVKRNQNAPKQIPRAQHPSRCLP